MNLTAGISATTSAIALLRALRDAAKSGQSIDPAELAGRIGEIYDYIGDAKDSLNDAKDQIIALQEELAKAKRYTFHDSVSWKQDGQGLEDGPFCPTCLAKGIEMRLHLARMADQTGENLTFECAQEHPNDHRLYHAR